MALFGKILIANRGEIAVRIIRTLKEMGIRSVTIFTEPEKDAVFVKEADESYPLGTGSILDTYLNIEKIISIAVKCNADAIHPGYGFLSENPEFAGICKQHHITFIGPSADIIQLMGNKTEALKKVNSLGIPTLFLSDEIDKIRINPYDINYPVIIKPVAGGGGKGMRIVHHSNELQDAIQATSREALQYFGNPQVFIEKYIPEPRHIEVQILGDHYGNIIHLFERECTIQRRHQKIIEEAPSPALTDNLRHKLLNYALEIAKDVQYTNAGTIEFLMDSDGSIYFIEMNTRIQVEHPVTEEITGIDIVKEQVRIAAGEKLVMQQSDIKINGHAIECRIYAEDAFNNFLPGAGNICLLRKPELPGIRLDSAIEMNVEVMSDYDPMLAKLTAVGNSREDAREEMLKALSQTIIHGLHTNIDYLKEILESGNFIQNNVSLTFCASSAVQLQNSFKTKVSAISNKEILAILLAFHFLPEHKADLATVFESIGYWRQLMKAEYDIAGQKYLLSFKKTGNNRFECFINNESLGFWASRQYNEVYIKFENRVIRAVVSENGHAIFVTTADVTLQFERITSHIVNTGNASPDNDKTNGYKLISPLHGKVIKVNHKINDVVKKGEIILVIESMKMENNIIAPSEGVIQDLLVNTGDRVAGKELLAVIA